MNKEEIFTKISTAALSSLQVFHALPYLFDSVSVMNIDVNIQNTRIVLCERLGKAFSIAHIELSIVHI